MYLFAKLVLAAALLAVHGGGSPDSSGPDQVAIIDPEQDKVVRTLPASDRIVREADALLQQRGLYSGLRVPEGTIIRIPLPGGRRIATRSGEVIETSELLLIRRKNTDEAVIVLFDQRHRPYVYAADRAALSRLLRLLEES